MNLADILMKIKPKRSLSSLTNEYIDKRILNWMKLCQKSIEEGNEKKARHYLDAINKLYRMREGYSAKIERLKRVTLRMYVDSMKYLGYGRYRNDAKKTEQSF